MAFYTELSEPSATCRIANSSDLSFGLYVYTTLIYSTSKYKIMKNVSCEYDRWVVETHFASCVVRKTRSVGALVLCSICNITVFVNYIYDMVVDTQFHKFHHEVGRSRVFFM